ncbi:MAG TPA: hypothetical protein VFR72_02635 [Gemmatimonadales bacterium]|nr:hypothetical protein [Gemmatimonadales bacterium]
MTQAIPGAPATRTLGAMPAQVHEPWAAQVKLVLGPATDPKASALVDEHWRAELEFATASLDQADLPPSARRRLTRLLAVDSAAS